jgi:glycosyltransferase involved in cell wall biosynthesis
LYVNLPINRKTFYSKNNNAGITEHCNIIKGKGDKIKKIKDNLWEFYPASIVESINWLPSTSAFKLFNYFNNKRFAKDIAAAVKEMGFRDIILFNDNDIFNGYHLKKMLSPKLYIYYCRDYLRGHDYWKKHCDVLEPELISKADLAVANSTYLTEYCSGFNKDSHYIGQGCNLELFDHSKPYPVPQEISHIASPIIGYVGAVIAYRLDENIIRIIAESNPSWNVVLVGPEDDVFQNSSLHQMPNVHFIGRKPIEELPGFVAAFDVCINPQLLSPITIGNYPLKVDEYLAMGKPVVATRTKTMEMFEEYTYLADKAADYPGLIKKALNEDSLEMQNKRIAFAQKHTWFNSVAELGKLILQKEKEN